MLRRMLSVAPSLVLAGLAAIMVLSHPALAGMGQPTSGQIGLQAAASPVAAEIHSFYNFVNFIITAIAVFVLLLLIFVVFKFNEKKNPTPSATTHHTGLEVAWTIIPIFILVAIAIPSFRLLRLQYTYPPPDVTIKATGYAWYWQHEYPDLGIKAFDSYVLDDDGRAELEAKGISAPRNLAVDNEVVVPLNKVVHVLVTADPEGVIHNWTIPSFGSKTDAVPGRVTTTWFRPTVEGVFYGQCSELCGKDHSLMPIAVRVVKQDVYDAWTASMKAWSTEKDSKKRKELFQQSKDLIQKAALEQAGSAKLAAATGQ